MTTTPSRKTATRFLTLLRRIHLYAGLFMLPWVFLYGVTGAMFNHQWLLPEAEFTNVPADQLSDSTLQHFPSAAELASDVVDEIQRQSPDAKITLPANHNAEFNNPVILEVKANDSTHAVHIDPVTHAAQVVKLAEKETFEPLLTDIRNVHLKDNPYQAARSAVPSIMQAAGIDDAQPARPRGWCKLNFLAHVDGQPVRMVYVLRDGHLDVVKDEGKDGMSSRGFFMRLHTSHGQPPHWNGRMYWSIVLDIMAISMVTWGITGIVMWWQLKRTRLIGGIVILVSIASAALLFISMLQFYSTTKL